MYQFKYGKPECVDDVTPDIGNVIDDWRGTWEDWPEMQEQVLAEWLIEYGFMPDTDEFESNRVIEGRGERTYFVPGTHIKWVLEDKSHD